MREDALERFVGCAGADAGFTAIKLFGRGEQRPSPSIGTIVAIARVDEVFGDNASGHLQTGDIGIETTAHLGSCEAAGSAQLTGDKAAVLLQSHEDALLDGTLVGRRMTVAAIVAEVGPPLAADEASLAVEELAIDAVALGDDGTLPLPQRPIPTAIRVDHIATLIVDYLLGREAAYAAAQQGKETDDLDVLHQLGVAMNGVVKH